MTNGGTELVDWFSGWWMRQGPGWGLPTRPRWLSALLFSPRQPSLVTMGGASLYSVWSTENLIIQANAVFPFSSIYSQKSLLACPCCGCTPKTQRFQDASLILEGETKGSVIDTPITRLSSDHGWIPPVRRTCALWTLFIWVFIRGEERNSGSYTFCPEIRLAHLSLTWLIRPNLHSQMRLIKMDLPFNLSRGKSISLQDFWGYLSLTDKKQFLYQ